MRKMLATAIVGLLMGASLACAPGAADTPTPAPVAAVPSPTPPAAQPTPSPADMATPGQEVREVPMQDIQFQPQEIEVEPGTTVLWENLDAVPHTVTAGTRGNPTGEFDSGSVASGETFRFTFEEPGTYEYYCQFHPGMDGTVVVEQ